MEKSSKKSSKLAFVFLLLAAALAGLSLWTSKLNFLRLSWLFIVVQMNMRWMFWLPTLLSGACLLPPLYSVLKTLHERKKLPPFIDGIFQDSFRDGVQERLHSIEKWLHSNGGALAVVGVSIFVFIAFLSTTALVREREANAYLNEFVSFTIKAREPHYGTTPIVMRISLTTASSEETVYLRYFTQIVRELESVDVKAVLIDVRKASWIDGAPTRKLLDVLASSKIVVLAVENPSRFQNTSYTRALFTYDLLELYNTRWLLRTQPEYALRYPGTPLDVSLELIRKYKNYSPELKPIQRGGSLIFGDYNIPITRDGRMLSRVRMTDDWRYAMFRISAEAGFSSDTLKYYFHGKYTDQLAQLRDQLAGRIVILNWYGHSYPPPPNYSEDIVEFRGTAVPLDNILHNDAIREVELSPLWLVIVCLAISGFIAYRFRPFVSVLLILLFGALVLVISSVLYDANILIQITYPFLSILLAMVIFPAITFIHRLKDTL